MYGHGRVFQRGRKWWIAYFHRGIEHREPTAAPNKTEAGKLLRAKLETLGAGQAVPSRRLTVADVVNRYLTKMGNNRKKSHAKAVSCAAPLIEDLGPVRVADLTDATIDAYVQRVMAAPPRRGSKPVGPATINRRLGILRVALRRAKVARHVDVSSSMLAEPEPRQGFFEVGDFLAVRELLPEHLKDAALFGYITAWRRSEVLGLTWSAVDRSEGEVRLATSKNDRPRSLPLMKGIGGLDGTHEVIERRWEARTIELPDGTTKIVDHVFHDRGKPLRDFRKAWATACEDAGVKGRLWHDMRRSGVRNMVRAGVPESIAMSISGHVTADVFKRYDITSQEDKTTALKQTLERLATRKGSRSVVPIKKAGQK